MIKPISLLIAALSLNSNAVTFEVIGPCSDKAVHSGSFQVDNLEQHIGTISRQIFNKFKIPYVGTETGFNSILNTPLGLDALEILSDTQMRSHGWCYEIDGEVPEVMPPEVFLNTKDSHIKWFYGYSFYDSGHWYDQCVPTYTVRPKQFCDQE